MVNITKLIGVLGKLEGSSARVTMNGKQIQQALAQGKANEVSEAIAGLVKKHPELKADVAYKVSEQGFTVGAVTLKDGKQVVARGAVSATGLGTEEAVLKARINIGKNGEIFSYSGYNDFAHNPTIQNMETSISVKNGVIESAGKNGQFSQGRCRLDIPKATEALGLKDEAALAVKKGNNYIEKSLQTFRDLFAGKEVNMGEKPTMPNALKKVKLSDKAKIFKEAKKYVKTPNGKQVPVEELQKTMGEYFEVSSKIALDNLKRGNEKLAYDIIQELKNLSRYAKEQKITIPGDWTKWLNEFPF